MSVDVVEFDRPNRLGTRTSSSLMATSGTLTFTPSGNGTLMTWDWHVQPKGWLRLWGPLFGAIGARFERSTWTGLKKHLEGTGAQRDP